MDIILEMPFLTLSNANIRFAEENLTWRTYTATDALPTIKRVQIIDQKEFAKAALDSNEEVFVVHIATITLEIAIHLARQAQIDLLKVEETPATVPEEYLDYADVFSEKLAIVLPEHTEINTHAIDLKEGKKPPYRPIYSLKLVELEILKTYIETNLANGFICPFKSYAGAPILFDQKPNGSLRLCVNYWGLNNLSIKNQYPLSLIGEFLDQLSRTKRFT